jgi:sugar/nucleoside kinase (ribokinase family)
MNRTNMKVNPFRPSVAGMGLIALDVVISEGSEPGYFAGGTCGNVLAILGYLGWHCVPIGRHRYDQASEIIRADLGKWGVDLSLLHLEPLADTPIVVERLEKDVAGIPYHRFSFFCPGCSRRYPRFQAVPVKSLVDVLPKIKDREVFFVDRVSAGSLVAAKRAKENGAVVFFEPPSASDDKNFRSMLATASIIKYSHDRIDELEVPRGSVTLEIQTLGRGGLRFRTALGDFRNRWHHLDAAPKTDLVDSAGAGDWLSAGLIHVLCKGGFAGLLRNKRQTLLRAFTFGQSLAVWNCGFVGARGGMYGSRVGELGALLKNHVLRSQDETTNSSLAVEHYERAQICSGCDLSFGRVVRRKLRSRAS